MTSGEKTFLIFTGIVGVVGLYLTYKTSQAVTATASAVTSASNVPSNIIASVVTGIETLGSDVVNFFSPSTNNTGAIE